MLNNSLEIAWHKKRDTTHAFYSQAAEFKNIYSSIAVIKLYWMLNKYLKVSALFFMLYLK
jgi:hypothetical protein